MLECPKCARPTQVIETKGERRRRQCMYAGCNHRFTTKEVPVGEYTSLPWSTQQALRATAESLEDSLRSIREHIKEGP